MMSMASSSASMMLSSSESQCVQSRSSFLRISTSCARQPPLPQGSSPGYCCVRSWCFWIAASNTSSTEWYLDSVTSLFGICCLPPFDSIQHVVSNVQEVRGYVEPGYGGVEVVPSEDRRDVAEQLRCPGDLFWKVVHDGADALDAD